MRGLIFFAFLAILSSAARCQILKPEEQHIPSHYEYIHSWDYAAPDGNGTIHCDETGTMDFYSDGTFADTAIQHHVLHTNAPERTVLERKSSDTVEQNYYDFHFKYYCQGQWRVDNGNFLFSEHAEGFEMTLFNEVVNPWISSYAEMIREKTLPNSSRWFTFDIERLDEEWFIWTYTYPNGRKDSWEMKRVKKDSNRYFFDIAP